MTTLEEVFMALGEQAKIPGSEILRARCSLRVLEEAFSGSIGSLEGNLRGSERLPAGIRVCCPSRAPPPPLRQLLGHEDPWP